MFESMFSLIASLPDHAHVAFFKEFVKNPSQVGSIIPSSRFLRKSVLDIARVESANTIIELGSGMGETTRAILDAMPAHGKLLSIEINPHFHNFLNRIQDQRLITHLGSASELETALSKYELKSPDVVISGIPFSTMSHQAGTEIVKSISSLLAPNGRFVAYQFRNRVANLCRPVLGSEQKKLEPFNIPPMRVYHWEKNNGHTQA